MIVLRHGSGSGLLVALGLGSERRLPRGAVLLRSFEVAAVQVLLSQLHFARGGPCPHD